MNKTTTVGLLLILLVFCIKRDIQAQVLDFLPFKIAPGVSLLPSPSLSYSPETSWSFGAAFITTFKADQISEKYLSKTHLDIIYTLQKQFIFDIDYDVFLAQGQWFVRGSSSFYDYPEYYHSMSGDPEESSSRELIESKRLELNNTLMYRLPNSWYVGILHLLQQISDLNFNPEGSFASEQGNPQQKLMHQGLGIGLTADLRSYPLNPLPRDSYFSIATMSFPQLMGTPQSFTRTELDWRHYLPGFRSDQLLALQAYGMFTSGAPPLQTHGAIRWKQADAWVLLRSVPRQAIPLCPGRISCHPI